MPDDGAAARLAVVGLGPEGPAGLSPSTAAMLDAAEVVAGGRRHLRALEAAGRCRGACLLAIDADLDPLLASLKEALDAGRRTVVVASGDPGFFGIGRALAEAFGPERLVVVPAASSIGVAFARLGLPWDDAVVASAHGRSLEEAVAAVLGARKAAVLTSPASPPQAVAAALLAAGAGFDRAVVASGLGSEEESIETTTLDGLAAGTYRPDSVVVLLAGDAVAASARVAWPPAAGAALRFALPEDAYEHRGGMITKAEVRALVIARLELPGSGVLWDVGAGSGSVGIECARLAPGLAVVAVERRAEDAERIASNARRHGVAIEVVVGEAPAVLADLASARRAFVGGGGLAVLEAVAAAVGPTGRVVATFVDPGRAAAAAEMLGEIVQLSAARGERLADGSLRLAPIGPVFVVSGPGLGR